MTCSVAALAVPVAASQIFGGLFNRGGRWRCTQVVTRVGLSKVK